jgi:Arc/MetJ-type ribon-helix-helix transcriptional regulator
MLMEVAQVENKHLFNITINLPLKYLDGIELLVLAGLFNSRSEAIRAAVHDFLQEEIGFAQFLGGI